MKEPKLHNHPGYQLLKQSDIVSFFHMQMPRWLFFDPKYLPLSLESKVAYTFLLNRFQLSKMNGWVNGDGEVFIIFPREKLAEEMGVSYRKAIACFKELLGAGLIWEHRIGRGSANRIYLAAVTLSEESAAGHESAPFIPSAKDGQGEDAQGNTESTSGTAEYKPSRSAEIADQEAGKKVPPPAPGSGVPKQEVPYARDKKCQNRTSRPAESALPDMPIPHRSKKEFSKIKCSDTDKVRQSCNAYAREGPDGQVDGDSGEDMSTLSRILEECELDVFPKEEAGVFRNAITRLYFSESFRIGNAVLPGAVVRSHLHSLDVMILLDTREKLRRNLDKPVKNSTAYVMATLLNNIWEAKSDLMVDPYLNTLGAS